MKHKTWFRLVVKAIGLVFIGLSVEPLAWAVGAVIDWMIDTFLGTGMAFFQWGWTITYAFSGLFLLGSGLYLFFSGEWVVNLAIPSNRPYCPDCGYELTRLSSERCPECGCKLAVRIPPRGD